MARKKKHPVTRVRRRWVRNPVTKPHSTPKGAKGYDRLRKRADLQEHLEANDE